MGFRKSVVIVLGFACLSVCGLSLADDPPPRSPSMPEVGKPLHCIIQGQATCKPGETPTIRVSLVNQTEEEIFLVGSLDASDCKWRYPYCYFEVIAPDGKQVPASVARCGMTNPLRAKDFVKLAPNASFDPYKSVDDYGFFSAHQLRGQNFTHPGKYRIRFVYSTTNDDVAQWRGNGGDPELARLLKQVPKTEVKSDEFIVTVVAEAE